jgi:hypothetical protein
MLFSVSWNAAGIGLLPPLLRTFPDDRESIRSGSVVAVPYSAVLYSSPASREYGYDTLYFLWVDRSTSTAAGEPTGDQGNPRDHRLYRYNSTYNSQGMVISSGVQVSPSS